MRINRKEIKRRARHVVKRHYFLLVALCLVAAAIGTEFTGSLDFLKIPSGEPVAVETTNAVVTGQPKLSLYQYLYSHFQADVSGEPHL